MIATTVSTADGRMRKPDPMLVRRVNGLLRGWAYVVMDVAVFPLGALLLYNLMYRTRLVPRWITCWGIIAAVLYLAAGLGTMFGLSDSLSTALAMMNIPLALQGVVLAIWLIVKGFNQSAITPNS